MMERLPLREVTRDLELLKLRLSRLEADAVTPEETAAMAQEIGAIRLQLKRLRLDQVAMRDAVRGFEHQPYPSSEVGRTDLGEPLH